MELSNAVPVTNNTATNSNSKMLSSKIIQLNDLSKHPLILYRRYERLILDTFHEKNLDPEIFCLCDDAKSALLWAKDGLATAISPKSMQSLCTGLRIYEIDEPTLITQIVLIWKKEKKLSLLLRISAILPEDFV